MFSLFHKAPPLKVVEVEIVKPQNFIQTIRIIGTVQAYHQADLRAKEPGVLDKIFVSSGLVKKGQRIATLKNQSQSESLKVAETIEKKQYQRAQSLFKHGAISGKDLEDAHKAYLRSKTQASDVIEFTAPFDGSIGVFYFMPGMAIKAGERLVSIYDASKLFVRSDLSDDMAQKIKVGSPAFIGEKRFSVTSVQNMIDPESHLLPLMIDTPDLDQLIGSEVFIDLVLHEKEGVITIPKDALLIREGKNYVYKVEKGMTIFTPVTLGLQQKERFEILKGLKEGDYIVKRGVGRLMDKEKVKVYCHCEAKAKQSADCRVARCAPRNDN